MTYCLDCSRNLVPERSINMQIVSLLLTTHVSVGLFIITPAILFWTVTLVSDERAYRKQIKHDFFVMILYCFLMVKFSKILTNYY